MPTQVPSGSPLVPKSPQRRRRAAAGPRTLAGYAAGGLVALPASPVTVKAEEVPIGTYAKGGMVKKKSVVGPRRLAYAGGGLVKGKDMTVSRDHAKSAPPPEKQESAPPKGRSNIKT